jgi:hypothetical protein
MLRGISGESKNKAGGRGSPSASMGFPLYHCGERVSSPRQIGAGSNKKRGVIGLSLRRELGRTLAKRADKAGATTKKEVPRK